MTAMEHYHRVWAVLIPDLVASNAQAPHVEVIVHLPKTGGTTMVAALEASSAWRLVHLPASWVRPGHCQCGTTDMCVDNNPLRFQASMHNARSRGRPLMLKLPHETYDVVDWYRLITQGGTPVSRIIMGVRPTPTRLRSMFTDYWTQVGIAEGKVTDIRSQWPHRARILRGYAADATHYRRADGSIDGRSWFQSFATYGGGVPFFMSEVFGPDPDRLRRELDSGVLHPFRTADVAAITRQLTSEDEVVHQRRSHIAHDPSITAAMEESADLIEELAHRDQVYDRILADHFDDESFRWW